MKLCAVIQLKEITDFKNRMKKISISIIYQHRNEKPILFNIEVHNNMSPKDSIL